MASKQDGSSYHHGDLRSSLVEAASAMLKEGGINNLSLRKLAERVGVSRTAAYHHFKNKNDLLCAIAEEGFRSWSSHDKSLLEQEGLSMKDKYRQLVKGYILEATSNPDLFDLMFGRTIWKQGIATEELQSVAYRNFQFHLELTKRWQDCGLLPSDQDTLRVSQVTWATMHGIARLLADGIYADQSNLEEMVDCAVNLFAKAK